VEWRRARDAGALAGMSARAAGGGRMRATSASPGWSGRSELEQELAKTRFVVEVYAELHALLETIYESRASRARVNTVTDAAVGELAPANLRAAACHAAGAAAAP
jgi:transposase